MSKFTRGLLNAVVIVVMTYGTLFACESYFAGTPPMERNTTHPSRM